MMWLGRTDFRMLETVPSGAQRLNRRDVEAAFALVELLDERRVTSYRAVDDAIRAFVGEQDYLTVDQMGQLAQNLGITRRSDLAGLSDDALAQGLPRRPSVGNGSPATSRRSAGADAHPSAVVFVRVLRAALRARLARVFASRLRPGARARRCAASHDAQSARRCVRRAR